MSEKLNHSDLSALLAKEANISVAKADAFTKALFDIIIEGLEQDGVVKINGLGTFKITEVADRFSVNVNTGEKFEIKGHKKLAFAPAESLKESVNRPFAMFEPVEIDENYNEDESGIDGETESIMPVADEEITDTPVESAFNVSDVEEEMPREDECDIAIATTTVQIEEEQCREETENTPNGIIGENIAKEEHLSTATTEKKEVGNDIPVEQAEDVSATKGDDAENTSLIIKENSVVEESVTAKPEQAVDVQSQSETEKQPTPIKKKSKSRFYLYLILGFAVGVILINSLKREHTSDVKESTAKSEPITVQVTPAEMNEKPIVVAENASDSITVTDEEIDTKDNLAQENSKVSDVYSFVMLDELAARSDKDITDADTTLYVIDGEIAIHVVADNERLAKIANDYYGSRKLWPYIARHNNLRKPYGIAVGMKLSIPKLHPVK